MFFAFFWSSLRSSLSFAFASPLRRRLDFFVSVFSSGFPPRPLPLLSFEQRFGHDDDEKKEDESDRAFGSRARAFERKEEESRLSVALAKSEDFSTRREKQSIKMSSETRRARVPLVATVFDASSRLDEARVPFSLPFLLPLFLREDVDVFVVVIVERSARRKDAQRRHHDDDDDDGEAISIQFRERERRCTTPIRALKDAHVRARRRRGICKDNRRFKSNSRE
jgi:hypothetical protein